MPATLPEVASRIGSDPEPLDSADPQDAAWLRALIWPEQTERAQRLGACQLRPEDGLTPSEARTRQARPWPQGPQRMAMRPSTASSA